MIEGVQEPIPEVHTGPFVSASAPAIGRAENEDLAGTVGGHTAWVLDGADDPFADKEKCTHGAGWYVRTLHQALAQSLTGYQRSLSILLQRAIQYTREVHESECLNPSHRKPSAAVAIIRCRPASIDYLVLGDTSILLESSNSVLRITDQRMHQVASDVRHAIIDRLEQGHGYDDPQRPGLLRELVKREQRARNKAAGYSIAAYDPMAAFDSISKSLSLNSSPSRIHRAALLSDGAERAVSTFGLCPDWKDFMNVVSTEGPAACIRRIQDAELQDRAGQEYPRTKFSDDASIVLWTRSKQGRSSSNPGVAQQGSSAPKEEVAKGHAEQHSGPLIHLARFSRVRWLLSASPSPKTPGSSGPL
jgi:Protein phosphatase 2C